ncbi:MAG: ribosomal protein S18-alanine N-acetyltransferase [Thermodesulfobacteriota bacterium]
MTANDIDEVVAIEQRLFPSPWLRQSYEHELVCETARSYIMRCCRHDTDGQPLIAYAALRLMVEEIQLLRLGVAEGWQRRGAATYLLHQCLIRAVAEGAENAFLEVRASNSPAIHLYQRLGFRLIGRRPNYYSDTHEDALMMIKNLKEEHNER